MNHPPDFETFCPWVRDFIGELYDMRPDDDSLRVALPADRWRGLRAYGEAERAYRIELRAHRKEFSAWLKQQAVGTAKLDDDLAIEVAIPVPHLPPETPERGSFLGILLGHEIYFEVLP